MDKIKIVGARIHNLKNISVDIPKGKIILITGVSEPIVSLSFYDAVRLMDLLEQLVQEGNSVIIIEHDPDILGSTDYIIELGPKGGPQGGEVIAIGTPEEIKNNKNSNTGFYLN